MGSNDMDCEIIVTSLDVRYLQKVDVMVFLGNLESTSYWRGCEVEALCPLCHVTSAPVATLTATEVQHNAINVH